MILSYFLQLFFHANQLPLDVNAAVKSSTQFEEYVFEKEYGPQKNNAQSIGVQIEGSSGLVFDVESGKVLFAKNPEEVRSIASLTKLMTALVFLDTNPNWEAYVTYKQQDETNIGSVKIYRGDTVQLEDIFNVALAASDNNSIHTLIRATGMSEEIFVKRMNEKASELGMENTSFEEPTGLSDNNVSTVFDLGKLIYEASKSERLKETLTMENFSVTTKEGRVRRLKVTDQLLGGILNQGRYEIEIGKTGYIPSAGYCFGAMINDSEKNAKIIALSLNGPEPFSRFQDVKAMSIWAFENFDWK